MIRSQLYYSRGGDYQTFKEVALAYGESVGFVFVENYDKLVENFESYKDRIVACIDMNTQVPEKEKQFYQYIEANGCGTNSSPCLLSVN